MNKSPKSLITRRIGIIAGVVLVTVFLLARPLGHYAHTRALDALAEGNRQSDPARALVWYRVAYELAPRDPQVLEALAAADIKTGNDTAALTTANRAIAHGAGDQGQILKSQALLELGRTSDAIAAVQGSTSEAARIQLGIAYATASDYTRLQATIDSLGTSGAAQTLSELEHNHFSLAQKLYVLGLLHSSQRVLDKYQVESSQYYLLKALITMQLGRNSKNSLEQGRGLLVKAVTLSPERIDLRQALQTVDSKLGDSAAAAEQGSKIQALQAGKV